MWTEQQRYKRRLHDTVQDIAPQDAQRRSRYNPAGRTAQADHLSRFVPGSSDGCFLAVPGENSPLRGSNTHQLTAYSRLLPNGLSLSSYDPACCCTACGYVSAASCSVRPTATFLHPVAIFLTCSWLPFYRVFISLCHFSFLITFPSVISPPAPCHFLSTFHRRQIKRLSDKLLPSYNPIQSQVTCRCIPPICTMYNTCYIVLS